MKNGASTFPVERTVSFAVFDGPSIAEQAIELVMQEPKAEEEVAEAVFW